MEQKEWLNNLEKELKENSYKTDESEKKYKTKIYQLYYLFIIFIVHFIFYICTGDVIDTFVIPSFNLVFLCILFDSVKKIFDSNIYEHISLIILASSLFSILFIFLNFLIGTNDYVNYLSLILVPCTFIALKDFFVAKRKLKIANKKIKSTKYKDDVNRIYSLKDLISLKLILENSSSYHNPNLLSNKLLSSRCEKLLKRKGFKSSEEYLLSLVGVCDYMIENNISLDIEIT